MPRLTVASDGSGDYTRVQDAVDAVRVHWPEETVIFIKNGVYREKVVIPDNKNAISLVGESVDQTIITWHEHARMTGADGQELGTFRTPVITATGDDVRIKNLTIENTAGVGEGIGQALALYLAGDRAVIRRVRLLSWQDTLYTCRGRHYFKDCYIAGHVDFIFGGATAVFDECEIHSLRKGYITAASTAENQPYGYVFLGCRLTGSAEEGTVYLGRPWRPHGHTVFVDTWMGPHIRREGWHNWGSSENEQTARYAEYGSMGPGAAAEGRAAWAKQLTAAEAGRLTVEHVLAGADGWKPQFRLEQ